MHFNTIRSEKGKRFLEICQKHKDRISLEFGLQTVHDEEMKILRKEKPCIFKLFSFPNILHIIFCLNSFKNPTGKPKINFHTKSGDSQFF